MLCARALPLVVGLFLSSLLAADDPPKPAVRIGSTSWRVPESYDFTITGDSKHLVVQVGPREVRFWDATTGKVVSTVTGPTPGSSIEVSGDGKQLLVREEFDRLRLWDVATSKPGKDFTRKNESIGLARLAPDGKWLAATSGDTGMVKDVTVWGTGSGRAFFTAAGDPKTITGLAISHDSGILATVGSSGQVILWDPTDGSQLAKFAGTKETGLRSLMAFSKDDKTLTVVTGSVVVRWDIAQKKEASRLVLDLPAVALTHHGDYVATRGPGGIGIDPTAGPVSGKAHIGPVPGTGQFRFAPDGSYLAMLGNKGVMQVWTRDGRERSAGGGHTGAIQALAFLPDSKQLLSASADGTARLWDAASGQEVCQFEERGLSRAAVAPEGKLVAAGGDFGRVGLFAVARGRQLASLKDAAQSFAFAPDGKTLVTLSGRKADAKVRVWSTEGKEVATYPAPEHSPRTLLVSADGTRWAVGDTSPPKGQEPQTTLLDPTTGKAVATVEGRPFCFSPDGKSLLTADRDGLMIYGTEKGAKVRTIPLKGAQPLAGAWSPDGKTLAVSQAASVMLWNAATGQEVGRLVGHDNHIEALAFSPDGKWLASGGKDTLILVWEVR